MTENKKVHWKAWSFLKRPKALGGLGFRDLTFFNKALLARQVWRIIERPDSLVAQVLKARYFKHTDIMDSLSSNPSYVWRSLLWSRDIITKGLIWKVGNSYSINARRDAWIPSLKEGRISSNVSYDSNILIKDLINYSREWDIQKANSIFLPYEVSAIKKSQFWKTDILTEDSGNSKRTEATLSKVVILSMPMISPARRCAVP